MDAQQRGHGDGATTTTTTRGTVAYRLVLLARGHAAAARVAALAAERGRRARGGHGAVAAPLLERERRGRGHRRALAFGFALCPRRVSAAEVFPVVKDVFREGGAVAFACSALLLLLYRLLPRVRRTPGWLILRTTVYETLVSIVFFLFYYFDKDKNHTK